MALGGVFSPATITAVPAAVRNIVFVIAKIVSPPLGEFTFCRCAKREPWVQAFAFAFVIFIDFGAAVLVYGKQTIPGVVADTTVSSIPAAMCIIINRITETIIIDFTVTFALLINSEEGGWCPWC